MSGKNNVFRIVAIGGSTTRCDFLDDSTEWPHLLMQELNSKQHNFFVFVTNAGLNGQNTADHLELLRKFPIAKNADLLLFLIGSNDLEPTLAFDGASAEALIERRASATSFDEPKSYPFYTRLRLYHLFQEVLQGAVRGLFELRGIPDGAQWYVARRLLRARGPRVRLPDLKLGLQEYQGRIIRLADYCRMAGKRCVFMTQPTMWRSDLTPREVALLWGGWTGPADDPKGFVSIADLAKAMYEFNRALLQVCRSFHLECYDLAAAIPKNESAFFDDCHFNENGARLAAKFIETQLIKGSPLGDAGTKASVGTSNNRAE